MGQFVTGEQGPSERFFKERNQRSKMKDSLCLRKLGTLQGKGD